MSEDKNRDTLKDGTNANKTHRVLVAFLPIILVVGFILVIVFNFKSSISSIIIQTTGGDHSVVESIGWIVVAILVLVLLFIKRFEPKNYSLTFNKFTLLLALSSIYGIGETVYDMIFNIQFISQIIIGSFLSQILYLVLFIKRSKHVINWFWGVSLIALFYFLFIVFSRDEINLISYVGSVIAIFLWGGYCLLAYIYLRRMFNYRLFNGR